MGYFKGKSTFLTKLLVCIMSVCLLLGTLLSVVNPWKESLAAKAETVEYQDLLAVEDRSWGAASDEYYFGGYTIGASIENNAHWLNTDASVNGCWYNGNDALITANNGVDILQYIYINDTSARDAITENVNAGGTLVGSSGWLTNPAASPVYVETTNGSGLLIKVLKAYAGETYTLTFKQGFSLIKNDGNVLYLSDDVVYNCVENVPTRVDKSTLTFNDENNSMYMTKRVINNQAVGTLPEVPAKDGYVGYWSVDGARLTESTVITANKTATPVYCLEYQDLLGLEDRTSWGAHDGEYYFGGVTLDPFGYFNSADSVKDTWYVGNTALITANNGVDIMEYIYVNGVSARKLITDNANGDRIGNSCDCWLSNPAACPVYVETTNGSGIIIRILKSHVGDSFTFTFKAGFSLLRNDGERIYVSDDIDYTYTNGTLTRVQKYTLTFENESGEVIATKRIPEGNTLGELPEPPQKESCEGVWTIDGVEIAADTPYTYGANKTATVVYFKNVTETIGLGDWGVPETESDIRYLWIRDNNAEIATAYPNSYWNDHADNKDSNLGIDILEYILIDGESVRSIIAKNASGETSYTASSTFPLNNGGIYAPVCVETAGDGVRFKVMVDYKTSFLVTFKAGFTIMNTDGVYLVVDQDVTYFVGETMGDITSVQDSVKTVTFNAANGETWEEELYGGQCVAKPTDPVKAATSSKKYAFVGWYNGDTKFDFATPITEDITLTAKYQEIALIGLSDLYDESSENTTGEFKKGEITIVDGAPQVGVNTNEAFELSFEFGFTEEVEHLAAFEVKMAPKLEASQILPTAQFYLGWRFYLYRTAGDGVNPYRCIQLLKYNDETGELTDRRLILENGGYENADAGAYVAGGIYQVAIGYRLIDAATGTVELSFSVGDWTVTHTEELGADYYNAYQPTSSAMIFTAESVAKTVTLADVGKTGKPNFEATFVGTNGATIEGLTQVNNQITLPSLEAETVTVTPEGNLQETTIKQVLLGWTTDATFGADSPLYPVGYKLSSADGSNKTLYAVCIQFAMDEGAGVRTAQDSGLRFRVFINGAQLNDGAYRIQSFGTLIAPTDYIAKAGAFTHDALGGTGSGNFVDRVQEKWADQEDAFFEYTAALVGIEASQYARAFSARGYLCVAYTDGNVGYVYTDYVEAEHSRSIYDVATAAYKDESENYNEHPVVQGYVNSVLDLTWETVAAGIVKNTNAVGGYELNATSQDGATFTVSADGVDSLVINGKRLVQNRAVNVAIGGVVYGLTLQSAENGSLVFAIGAVNDLGDKQSDETLYFASANADLDFFLNDYFKRHSGYIEDGVNLNVNSATAGAGSEEFFSHEWMSRSYYWFNSFDGYGTDRIEGLRSFLSSVPVDDYGYVWSSNDRVRDAYTEVSTGEQKMGWPFPNNDTVSTSHWEFNSNNSGSWSSNVSASVSGGLYQATLSGQSSNITFTSNSFSSWTSKKIYTKYAPLLEFELRIEDATNVEDIYVWYTTSSSTSFSEDKKVSVNEKAFIKYDYSGKYEHVLYLPMYAESAWGESTSTYVKQLKIEIALKSGTSLSGTIALNYVRPTLDTRMSNNNSILISSLRQDYDYTGDLDYLTENITRARKAMNFLMQMYDASRGLKKESYLVGHGGTKESLNWLGNATAESIADSISQGYWDIMYMPEYDFQSNTYFYKAAADMAYLEGVLAANGITVDTAEATVKTATRSRTYGTSAYAYTQESLNSVANTVLANLRQTTEDTNHTGFWDATDGRFVAGYASGEGKWYDYGYVTWNLEAIYYGIATEEQAAAIMNWLNGESGLYDYVFAPRSNTVSGTDMLNGEYAAVDWEFGDNCQYGGAIMYSSFFDLMARISVNGADDAYARLTAIQAWYKEVYDYYVANGSDPYDFYRYYYDNKGIQLQGLGTAGALGLDREFLESFLPVSAVAYGFFGIDSIDGKTLKIAPELPTELSSWGAENLAFNFVKYDLKATKNSVQITSVRGDTAGLSMQVTLDCADGQSVYVNGVKQSVAAVNGKVTVTVAFGALTVEVR